MVDVKFESICALVIDIIICNKPDEFPLKFEDARTED